MTKPKALDLAGWRRTQTEPDPKGGTRQLTQRTLAVRIAIAPETLCRIERGKHWPSAGLWLRIFVDGSVPPDVKEAQVATWRAYSPDRKGKRP